MGLAARDLRSLSHSANIDLPLDELGVRPPGAVVLPSGPLPMPVQISFIQSGVHVQAHACE